MKNMRKLTVLLLSIIILSLIAGCGTKSNEDKETSEADGADGSEVYEIKIANAFTENVPRAKGMEWFSEEIEKRTDGQIKSEYYANGVLGNEEELSKMIPTNDIQLYMGAGWESLSSKFSLWNIPFAFESYEEIEHFNDSELVEDILSESSKNGFYIPTSTIQGFRNIETTDKLIKEPEDLEGLKMRAPGQPMIIDFYKTLGANPISMDANDVYMALSTGTVDGQCNSSTNNYGYKFYEVAENATWIDYATGVDPIMISEEWYNSLPEDLQSTFDDVVLEMRDMINEIVKTDEIEASKMVLEESAESFKLVGKPEIRQRWIDATKDVETNAIEDGQFTEDDVDEMEQILEDYRNNN